MRKPKSAAQLGGSKRRRRHVESDEPPDVLTGVAKLVKLCYIGERSRWESLHAGRHVPYRPPSRYDGAAPLCVDGDEDAVVVKAKPNEWIKLARRMQQEGLPPEAYIRLQFELLSPIDEVAPEPAQLCGDRYLSRWRQNKDLVSDRIRLDLKRQLATAEASYGARRSVGIGKFDAWEVVLANKGLELSPLFRYCYATILGGRRFERLAACFEDQAVLQFERNRDDYLRWWYRLLPPGFSDRARDMYPYLL